jgi:hypothetical protein
MSMMSGVVPGHIPQVTAERCMVCESAGFAGAGAASPLGLRTQVIETCEFGDQ